MMKALKFMVWLFAAVLGVIGGLIGLIAFLLTSPFIVVVVMAIDIFSICGKLALDATNDVSSRMKNKWRG